MKQMNELKCKCCATCIFWKEINKTQNVKSIVFNKFIERKVGKCFITDDLTTEDFECKEYK